MDDNGHLPSRHDGYSDFISDCKIRAHASCDAEYCEINRTIAAISEGQVKITVLAAACSLVLSTVFGAVALALHAWGVIHSIEVPIPWWMITIMGAPFGAGFALKIREKVPYRIERSSNDGE